MDDLMNQLQQLNASWTKTFDVASANPSAWQPYLPNSSIVVLDEVIKTINYWMGRTRAPNGFSPGFAVARSVAFTTLPQLTSTAQLLESGQYNHLPVFVTGLLNLLTAIHTMAIYSTKDADSLQADLSAELAQALSLLDTAQRELANKKNLLEQTSILANEIEDKHVKIIATRHQY